MRGLYIHIPFCVRKCAYCDFYSVPVHGNSLNEYVKALLRESTAYAGLSFQTLYLGGGTPSLLGAENLVHLIQGLHYSFDLSGVHEATMEANPESVTEELLIAAKEAGINRISIGVQSLADNELKRVCRIHSASQAIQAVQLTEKLGLKISADLIVGLPAQNWETLRSSIGRLLELNVMHLSLYCLSLELGTPLYQEPPADLPSEDEQAELFTRASSFLADHGFLHYEISNFALLGYECQHNLNYWRGGEYLGLGPAAASHLQGKRFRNRPDLTAYIQNPTGQIEDTEELDWHRKAAEEAMLGLRLLTEGINTAELARRYGHEPVNSLLHRLEAMAEEGMLIQSGSAYRLTPSRVLTSNPIFARVLND